jgi:NCS2 family nucleobase:cation symporter-2
MTERDGSIDLAYGLEDKPPALEAIFLGIQHVAAMIVPATAVALIVGGGVGAGTSDTSFLVQMVLVFSGLATLVQCFPSVRSAPGCRSSWERVSRSSARR